DYREVFSQIFPKQGLLALNHNDVHRLNFLALENDKLMLIDHEYAALNLIGIDIVNYLIETNFNYKVKQFPFFDCTNDLDYQKMYKIYLNYIDIFEENIKNREEMDEKHKNLFAQCRTKTYFLHLICTISLFCFIYSVIYLNWSSFDTKNF